MKYSYAFIAMPGGFGKFDELFEIATLIQTGKDPEHFPIMADGQRPTGNRSSTSYASW